MEPLRLDIRHHYASGSFSAFALAFYTRLLALLMFAAAIYFWALMLDLIEVGGAFTEKTGSEAGIIVLVAYLSLPVSVGLSLNTLWGRVTWALLSVAMVVLISLGYVRVDFAGVVSAGLAGLIGILAALSLWHGIAVRREAIAAFHGQDQLKKWFSRASEVCRSLRRRKVETS